MRVALVGGFGLRQRLNDWQGFLVGRRRRPWLLRGRERRADQGQRNRQIVSRRRRRRRASSERPGDRKTVAERRQRRLGVARGVLQSADRIHVDQFGAALGGISRRGVGERVSQGPRIAHRRQRVCEPLAFLLDGADGFLGVGGGRRYIRVGRGGRRQRCEGGQAVAIGRDRGVGGVRVAQRVAEAVIGDQSFARPRRLRRLLCGESCRQLHRFAQFRDRQIGIAGLASHMGFAHQKHRQIAARQGRLRILGDKGAHPRLRLGVGCDRSRDVVCQRELAGDASEVGDDDGASVPGLGQRARMSDRASVEGQRSANVIGRHQSVGDLALGLGDAARPIRVAGRARDARLGRG